MVPVAVEWAILPMRDSAWPAVREIYRQGIATGDATFQTEAPEWPEWDAGHLRHSRLVAKLSSLADLSDGPGGAGFSLRGALAPPDCNHSVTPAQKPRASILEPGEDAIGGWSALSPVSPRECYAGVAEVSIYIAEAHRGQGLGRGLLSALISESESHGMWTLQAGIFPENRASIALHERLGFREVGVRERIGQRDGRWRDTVLLERRSKLVGI